MDTQKIASLMKHGAIKAEHVDKMFSHPDKANIVDAVVKSADYKTHLPENLSMKILNDRSLLKHHRAAIDYGLGGAGADKYFKANAGRPIGDDFGEIKHHINALLAAGNHISGYGHEVRSAYHKLPDRVKAAVISGIRHSTTEDLNSIPVDDSTIANNLGNHRNSDDETMRRVHDSDLSPAVKQNSLLTMIENGHNKLSSKGVDHIHNLIGSGRDAFYVQKAVAQHPATSDETLRKIANSESDIGYGTKAAIMRHPNASQETKDALENKHGNI